MIKIYGYGPTRSSKCVWMARELGIDFELVKLSFSKEGFGDSGYRDLNPFGLVPAMEDGSFNIFESQAILNYLGEKYPEKGMVPKSGTLEKAKFDQWTFFCTSTLEPPLWSFFRHSFIFSEEVKDQKEMNRASAELSKILGTLNTLMEKTEFLISDRFTAADIAMTYDLNWAGAYGFLDSNPSLQRYIDRHKARPSYPRELYNSK